MKLIIMLASILLVFSCAKTDKKSDWGYSGDKGPENWAKLSPDNFACSGKNQSPINLSNFIESDLPPIKFNYKGGKHEILNNGHTVQVNYEKGISSSISIDGIEFKLLQYHFHLPAENSINGESYPMEVHLVHIDKKDHLGVIAVMFKEGKANKALANILLNIPKYKGDKYNLSMNAINILPKNTNYYRYNGSLTVPPCSEGARWLVMKDILTASKQQINAFAHVLHEPNNRPLQDIGARVILK